MREGKRKKIKLQENGLCKTKNKKTRSYNKVIITESVKLPHNSSSISPDFVRMTRGGHRSQIPLIDVFIFFFVRR